VVTLSPNFKYAILIVKSAIHIRELETNNRSKIQCLAKNICFTHDSRYVYIETEKRHKFYRVSDGSILASLFKEKLGGCSSKKIVFNYRGNVKSVTGFIDVPSRKFYPWSLVSLVHLCNRKLKIFPEDLLPDELKLC
jgi:hypothetical protein